LDEEDDGVAGVVGDGLDPAAAGGLAGFSDAAGDAGAVVLAGAAVPADDSPSFF